MCSTYRSGKNVPSIAKLYIILCGKALFSLVGETDLHHEAVVGSCFTLYLFSLILMAVLHRFSRAESPQDYFLTN